MTLRNGQTIIWDMENRPISIGGSLTEYESYHTDAASTNLNNHYVAQTFTPQTSHVITSFKMRLRNDGAAGGTITGYLRTTDSEGVPEDIDLAVSYAIEETSIPDEWTEVTFNFITGYPLEAETQYALIVHPTVGGMCARVNASGTYPGGQRCSSYDSYTVWNMSQWVAHDLWFEEWGQSSATTFVYDGDGHRVKKTVGGETTLYVNRYYEKTGTEITTSYYLGDKLIAVKKGTYLSYIHQDHLGSTSMTSNADGETESSMRFFPYGDCRNITGTIPTDKIFTGQRLDSTGLYYYGARYYDPSIGRFISADTIVPDPLNPQSLNRYSYCYNNPTKYIDKDGHIGFLALIGIGAVVGAAVGCISYAVTNRDAGYTAGGWAKAAVSGAVTGALAVTPLPFLAGTGVAGVGALALAGGVAGMEGTLAGEAVKSAINHTDFNPNPKEVAVSFGAGMVGSFSGRWASSQMTGTAFSAIGNTVNTGTMISLGTSATTKTAINIVTKEYVTPKDPQPAIPFTASLTQLNNYSSSVGTPAYQAAIDQAYDNVASSLGSNQMVGWSSERGYYAVDTGSSSYYDYWY